ncbi:hypothetical protein AX16_005407 [Volvariella volvacea WC 439]|nr:hypothetical protein AX16_005407 [Volvariella volvacea WC 439]
MSAEGQIPDSKAHLLSLAIAFAYVGSLYISKNARLSFSSAPSAPPLAASTPKPAPSPSLGTVQIKQEESPVDTEYMSSPISPEESEARRRMVRFKSPAEVAEGSSYLGDRVNVGGDGSARAFSASLSDFGSMSSIGSVSDFDEDESFWDGFETDGAPEERRVETGTGGNIFKYRNAAGTFIREDQPPSSQAAVQVSPGSSLRRRPLIREDAITQSTLSGNKPWPPPPEEKDHLKHIFQSRIRTQVEAQIRYSEERASLAEQDSQPQSTPPPIINRNKGAAEVERARGAEERWRNDPDVIRARVTAVSIATLLSCLCVIEVVAMVEVGTEFSAGVFWPSFQDFKLALPLALHRLGIYPHSFSLSRSSFLPHLLVPILYLGPLYATSLSHELPFQARWTWRGALMHLNDWQGVRNYIAAPITEELTFRSCILAVYGFSNTSRNWRIFGSPLFFGLAHVHHAWDAYNRLGRTKQAAKRAILGSAFQTLYTTLFGAYCSYLFMRTGSIWPPITAHIFCNFMGVPQLGYELEMNPHRRKAIKTAYLIGLGAFFYLLSPWTKTEGSLYWTDNSGWTDL